MSVIATTALAGIALMSAGHGGQANYGMAISPASVTGPSNSVQVFTVTDVGKTPLNVRVAAVELREIAGHKGALAPADAYTSARISDPSFQLQPGHFKKVTVTIKATDSYKHFVGIAATGQQASVKQGAAVQTAVISRYTVNPSGAVAPDHSKPIVADNHTQPHSSPIGHRRAWRARALLLGAWRLAEEAASSCTLIISRFTSIMPVVYGFILVIVCGVSFLRKRYDSKAEGMIITRDNHERIY